MICQENVQKISHRNTHITPIITYYFKKKEIQSLIFWVV